MKKLIAVLFLFATQASANQFGFLPDHYFRFIDVGHVHESFGAYVDPVNPGNSSLGKATAIFTHSTKDGCLLPSVVCEDWSPLMAGFSVNAGRLDFNAGPAANLAPLARTGLLGALNLLSGPDKLLGLKDVLQPSDSGLSIAFGPSLGVAPIQRGLVIPLSEWRGKFRVFAGAALVF